VRRNVFLVVLFGLVFFISCNAFAAELKDERLFYVNCDPTNAREGWASKLVELPGIHAVNPQSAIGSVEYFPSIERGKDLGAGVVRMFENLRSGGLSGNWCVMPLGKTDQAASFDAKGRLPEDAGAITFWFRGQAFDYTETPDKQKIVPSRANFRTWDVKAPSRETFFEVRGANSTVTFGKLESGKLVLETDGKKISLPIDFDVSLVHMAAINYADGKAWIYIDGKLKAEGSFAMPSDISRIVIGHIGPGGKKWNRWLDDFAVWKRPLTVAEIMLLRRKEGMIQLPLQVTIPKISSPPAIDGLMKADEWATAASVTGMHSISVWGGYSAYVTGGQLSDLKDRVFLAYDDKNLYVGYHCPPPGEIKGNTALIAAMLKRSISAFDANVDSDDAFHICIQYPKPGGDLYNLFVNGINTHYDFNFSGHIEGSRLGESTRPGFITLAWDPKWKSASTVDMDGWHLEMALPLDAFDIPAPKPGDVWYINFMRWWQTIRSGIQSWAWGNRTMDEDGNLRCGAPGGRMVFGGPGVIVRQQSTGEIAQGKPHFVVELVNTDNKKRSVTCVVETNSNELSDKRQISIPAGGKATYEFKGRIRNQATAIVGLKVVNEDGGTIAAASYPVLRPTEADIYFRKYPSFDLVKYEVDFTNHAEYEPSEISVDILVKNSEETVIWKSHIEDFTDYKFSTGISTKDLPLGKYTVDFIFKAGGKNIETARGGFEKKPLPEWFGNTFGFDGEIAPCPWKDIAVRNGKIDLWGRSYDFGNSLYPKSVTTQGREILRAPMRIDLVTAEGKLAPDAKLIDSKWTKLTPCRVEGTRSVKLGKLTVTNDFWIEYDGLVWSNLTLVPEGKVAVKTLAFEIPVNKDFSDVINTMDYSMRNTGKFKPEGFVGSASNPIWLGNAYGGIQWDTDTMGPFDVEDANTCVKAVYKAEGGTIRIEFINVETEITKPRRIPFCFMATPARPRVLRTVYGGAFQKYVNVVGFMPEGKPWVPFSFYSINKYFAQRGREYSPVRMPGIEGRTAQYATLMVIGDEYEAAQEFGDEWLQDESTRWRGKYRRASGGINVTTTARSLQEYFVWRFNESFKRQPIAGGYYDVASPAFSSNPYAGAGYVRDDGSRAPQLNTLGHRQVLKRVYNIQNTAFPGGGNWYHASEGPRMIIDSYCIGIYDGENYNSIINAENPTYRTMLRPDTYRAQYMGSNWGLWNHFLSQGRITAEAMKKYGFSNLWDQWTGLQLLHDSYCGTGWFGRIGHLEPLLTQREHVTLNKYHYFSPFNRFIGYWEQDITKLERPEFFASFYVKEPVRLDSHYGVTALKFYSNYDTGLDNLHQAILILYNQGTYEGKVRLKLDWKKLGFDDWKKVRAINAVHSTGFRVLDWNKPIPELSGELYDKSDEEYARIENGMLEFPITEYNYRMIVLQGPKPWKGLEKIEGKKK